MKRAVLAVALTLLAGEVFGQVTSRFEYLLRSYSTGRLVSGKDVDLWQGGVKKYDLTEDVLAPGVYYHTAVRYGEYDIYVDSTAFKTQVWIGSEKIKTVVDRIYDSSEISGLVSRSAIVQASDSVNASLISMSVTAGSYTSIASGRSGSGTFLPLTFWSNGSERMRLLTDGQFRVSSRLLVGGSSTDASLSAGVFIGNLTVASGAADASILNFSNAFGESVIDAGRTGSGTYQPLVLKANAAEAVRLNTDGTVAVAKNAYVTGSQSVASAATITLGPEANVTITGTTTIDSMDTASTLPDGAVIYVTFGDELYLRGVKNLRLGADTVQTAAGKLFIFQRRGNLLYLGAGGSAAAAGGGSSGFGGTYLWGMRWETDLAIPTGTNGYAADYGDSIYYRLDYADDMIVNHGSFRVRRSSTTGVATGLQWWAPDTIPRQLGQAFVMTFSMGNLIAGAYGNTSLSVGFMDMDRTPGWSPGQGHAVTMDWDNQQYRLEFAGTNNQNTWVEKLDYMQDYRVAVLLGGYSGALGAPYYAGETASSYPYGYSVFMKDPGSSTWQLLYRDKQQNDANLWPYFHSTGGRNALREFLVPDSLLVTPYMEPVHYTSMSGADGTQLWDLTPEVGVATWDSVSGDFQVVSNRIESIGGSARKLATIEIGKSDIYIDAVGNTTTSSTSANVLLRYSDEDNYWIIQYHNSIGGFKIFTHEGGTLTERAASGVSPGGSNEFNIRVRAIGDKVTAWLVKDGSLASVIEYESSFNNTATKHGIIFFTLNGGMRDVAFWDVEGYNALDTFFQP